MTIFKGYGKVEALLSNGEIIECKTGLIAYGWYKEVDLNTVEAEYPEDFDVFDDNLYEGITIVDIIKILDYIEWEYEYNEEC